MNFKIFLFLFISTTFGCGVKSQPLKRPEIAIDSYVQTYTGEPEKVELKKDEKVPSPSSSILEYKK